MQSVSSPKSPETNLAHQWYGTPAPPAAQKKRNLHHAGCTRTFRRDQASAARSPPTRGPNINPQHAASIGSNKIVGATLCSTRVKNQTLKCPNLNTPCERRESKRCNQSQTHACSQCNYIHMYEYMARTSSKEHLSTYYLHFGVPLTEKL